MPSPRESAFHQFALVWVLSTAVKAVGVVIALAVVLKVFG